MLTMNKPTSRCDLINVLLGVFLKDIFRINFREINNL